MKRDETMSFESSVYPNWYTAPISHERFSSFTMINKIALINPLTHDPLLILQPLIPLVV